jgi:hypothetical protein
MEALELRDGAVRLSVSRTRDLVDSLAQAIRYHKAREYSRADSHLGRIHSILTGLNLEGDEVAGRLAKSMPRSSREVSVYQMAELSYLALGLLEREELAHYRPLGRR